MPAVKPRDVAAAAEARERWAAQRATLLAGGASRPVIVTPSGLERYEGDAGGRVPAGADGALRFGSAFHKMMELTLQGPSPPGREAAAKAAAVSEGAEDMEAGILELAGRVLASPLIRKAMASERLLVEPPFSVAFEGGTLRGRADLVFREGDAWTVLDFKTDDITVEEVPARLESYRPQGAAYAWAMDHLGISPVGRVVFYFVRPDVEVSLEAGPGLLAEGERLVRSARPQDPPSPSGASRR
jgi:ATP-dependent helicase/nuclease subunit A